MLFLKNLLFTLIIPASVVVYVPCSILLERQQSFPATLGTRQILGLILFAADLAIYLSCLWDFARIGRATPAPIDPPRTLVVQGLYQYVRNPMYLGVLTMLAGESAFFESTALLAYMLGFYGFVHLFVVFYEERTLLRRFGESYRRYCQAVRRWLPGRPYRQ